MAEKRTDKNKSGKVANISSIIMFLIICGTFFAENSINNVQVQWIFVIVIMIAALVVMTIILRNTINRYKLAFNIPFVLLIFYTALILIYDWQVSHFLFFCIIFSAISCIYSNFNRTMLFMLVANLFFGFLYFRNESVFSGYDHQYFLYFNWAIFLFACIIMLVLTRAATTHLNKALANQQSFMDLLDSTENYVAMVNEGNEVVYASKTLSQLANTEEQEMVQGRPIIDLFPGRSLKIYASKLLQKKDKYADDWEFTLNGQKRYFKAASYGIRGGGGGALISLYDMTHLAERDEIAVMKDSMKIGLFFMDSEFYIQDHYSRYLEEMLSDTKLFGKQFTDVIADSVNTNELNSIKDYLKMILERTYDQEMLEDINPLNELHYINKRSGDRKVLQFAFATVERARGEVFILVTVYDITTRVELQRRLAEEEARRQEDMNALFELTNVEPSLFSDFMEDMEKEFETINLIQKNETLTAHEALVKIYQSIHAIKSNAYTLELNVFGDKVHVLETYIKKLRELENDIPFSEMLNLTMEIDKISNEREKFKSTINRLKVYTGSGGRDSGAEGTEKQTVKVLMESLAKTASRVAGDTGKQINFIANDIDSEAIENGPRRVIKEILMQLIRNSALHGVELPEERTAKGKNETGSIKLSIKMSENNKSINIKLSDDGQGLNYKKIAEKAVSRNILKEEDAENKDLLIKAIFSPGFSTSEEDGIHGGRGIGLNLVRDRLKEVSGTVKIRSEDDKGVLFAITIPMPA